MLQEMDPTIERILNEDEDFEYEDDEDIAYESAMEP